MPDAEETPQPTSSNISFPFTIHPSSTPFAVPAAKYLSTFNAAQEDLNNLNFHTFVVTGALIFDRPIPTRSNTSPSTQKKELESFEPRILLLQRAATDTLPNLWEIPGGTCEDGDESILHAVAREVGEETGLMVSSVGPCAGTGYSFVSTGGRVVRKVNFLVEYQSGSGREGEREGEEGLEVRLDPDEHRDYVWATEEEVRAGRVGGVSLRFTMREQVDVVLEGFRVRRELEMMN